MGQDCDVVLRALLRDHIQGSSHRWDATPMVSSVISLSGFCVESKVWACMRLMDNRVKRQPQQTLRHSRMPRTA